MRLGVATSYCNQLLLVGLREGWKRHPLRNAMQQRYSGQPDPTGHAQIILQKFVKFYLELIFESFNFKVFAIKNAVGKIADPVA
jgi:hypothetical protein